MRILIATVGLSLGTTSFAQVTRPEPRFELFSGISYQTTAVNGGNTSLSFRLREPFSLIADFSAHQEDKPEGGSSDVVYGLFGGQWEAPSLVCFQPFLRGTAGIAHSKFRQHSDPKLSPLVEETGLVWALGAGFDRSLGERLKTRLLQLDYISRIGEGGDPEVRLSAGLVVTF